MKLASTILVCTMFAIPASAATIKGTVRFQGPAPTTSPPANARCVEHDAPILDESAIVSTSGGLKNAVVYLENAPSSSPVSTPVLLDQINCRYVPHVLAIHTNQPLTIRSSDTTLHNVHLNTGTNPAANFGLVQAGTEKVISFKS